MGGYTKLYSSLVLSTVWREPNHVRIVWVTMLALADAHGYVGASVPGLADAARVSVDECVEALRRFQEPDPYSRTRDHEGRRIEPAEGGWRLLNHTRYREGRDPERRREQNREAQARWRDRQRKPSKPKVSQPKPRSAQAEAEAEAEAGERSGSSSLGDPWGLTTDGNADAPLADARSSAPADAPAKRRDAKHDPDVQRVFEFWQRETGHTRAKLDDKRANRIRKRLTEGFTADELEAAIRNRRNDPHLMGESKGGDGTVYDGIETLLRDTAQVERLRDLTAAKANGRGRHEVQRGSYDDSAAREAGERMVGDA